MRRITPKVAALVAIAMLALTAPAQAQRAAAPEAYFEFTDSTRERAVLKLTDPAKIQHARELVTGITNDRPHVLGRIVKRPAPYNPRWSYHYNPETVDFFDFAIEVCDASIPYVEDHLDEAGGAFLPGLVWCPWSSRLVREIPMP
ncbi:BP74-related protein [Nonomuraea glycinis]|uniref:BP74-related protein n=1 Tax=Nonomuraea glycinis TaxID=2047744 RepID=UPI002E11AF85|nr:calmodulin-binding protein [Nonomuraea glycinis]